MTDFSPRTGLPYIQPSQAMKHITHNEALSMIDSLVHMVVQSIITNDPANPPDGAVYLVGANPAGSLAGQAGRLALWSETEGWRFVAPQQGWMAFFLDSQSIRICLGGTWEPASATLLAGLSRLGISATADDVNRLSVSSQASLFNHAGKGHRLAINKSAIAETASILLQDGFTARAEIGLCGNDKLSVRTSGDGTTFWTALEIGPDGIVRLPLRPVVRATLADTNLNRTNTNTGFNQLGFNQGGFALGNPVPSGMGQRLIVPVSGIYHVTTNALASPGGAYSNIVAVNGVSSLVANTKLDNNATYGITNSASSCLSLNAGDEIWWLNTGSAELRYGNGKTELFLAML